DVAACLHALHKQGLRIGVARNQPVCAEQGLESFGLPGDFVASSERWNVKKPAPAFFQKVIDELHLAAGAIAYVGDRLDNDIVPARSAGMVAVFIRRGPWGFLHARQPEVAL